MSKISKKYKMSIKIMTNIFYALFFIFEPNYNNSYCC